MYEKMKYLVAEDGLAPSAYHRQVNCDLCHIAGLSRLSY